MAQADTFKREIDMLKNNKPLPAKNILTALAPFVDDHGLLRVGGRASNAPISYEQMHPLIIGKNHPLTKLLVHSYHLEHLHAGQRLLRYKLGLKYWILSASYVIKQCIYKCATCMRHRGKVYQQQMGDIPDHRLQPCPAFNKTAVDYAGPLQIRAWKGRGAKKHKCWIAVFVCMVTKAIHIELVTDLTSATFIAALRRFIARRGKPLHMFSDNGTNFVGADQHMTDLYQFLASDAAQQTITTELANQQIEWHFSPPGAPHFGGMWESGVRSIKYHLRRTLATSSTTYEELSTVLCQIKSCLNSRPLCLKFEDDVDPLTPAHFLIMRPVSTLPDDNVEHFKDHCLTRWQYMQRLVQQFWRKWSLEHITQLQQRPKWKQVHPNIKLDDIVLIKEENLPPATWMLGKISELHPGSDGLVRVVTVKTTKGYIKRPITKLCPLFIDV